MQPGDREYCAFVGRRDGKKFILGHKDIMTKYSKNIRMADRLPDVLAAAMGNQIYIATFQSKREMDNFFQDALKYEF